MCNGYRISVWEGEKVLEVDDGNGCTTVLMYLMPQNYTFRNGKNGKFYVLPQ